MRKLRRNLGRRLSFHSENDPPVRVLKWHLMSEKKFSLLPIFVTVFIDLLGVGLVIPIFAPLFLDFRGGLLPASFSLATRTMILGFMMAAFPLAQFFGSPILGALSDRIGRKKVLLFSLFGTFIGYILSALGITFGALWLLFLSRIIDGFTGGNISTAMSAIADLSDQKSKARNFGLIGMAFGLGFIIGPYVGGKLSDPGVWPWFNYSTPFLFAAVLCAFNIFLVLWRFRETLARKIHREISLFTGFKNIYRAFQLPNLRVLFTVVFLLTFGFNFFTQFFQVYLIERFHFGQGQIGDLFAFMGFWIALTQGLVTRSLSKKFPPERILKFTFLGMSFVLLLILFVPAAKFLYLVLPFLALFNGLTQPNTTALVSNLSDRQSQGEILGIQQSIQSAGMAIPPIIAGFLVSVHRTLPVLAGSVLIFTAWLVFVGFFKPSEKNLFHEI